MDPKWWITKTREKLEKPHTAKIGTIWNFLDYCGQTVLHISNKTSKLFLGGISLYIKIKTLKIVKLKFMYLKGYLKFYCSLGI